MQLLYRSKWDPHFSVWLIVILIRFCFELFAICIAVEWRIRWPNVSSKLPPSDEINGKPAADVRR